jgi:hypothetical protein
MMIGKIEIITHTTVRAIRPWPNNVRRTGTMARIGMAWMATA